MKATGIVRRIDDLGRIVIPKEIRRIIRVREGDPLEVYLEGEDVVFRKYSPMIFDLDSIKRVLGNKVPQFAVYDRWNLLHRKGNYDFPKIPPEKWEDRRDTFIDKDSVIYSVIANGELFGYVMIPGTEKSDFIKGVIAMMCTRLSE